MFKPLLAASIDTEADFKKVKFPCYLSPKIDGMRCLASNSQAVTRSFKDIPNNYVRNSLIEILKDLPKFVWLDGELVTDTFNFQKTSSELRKYDGTPNFTYLVFDLYIEGYKEEYHQRIQRAKRIVEDLHHPQIKLVSQLLVTSVQNVLSYEQDYLSKGYEGVMLRSIDGIYKHGRSTLNENILLKLKRFKQSEAEVIGFEEQMFNANADEKDNFGYAKRSSHQENMIPKDTLGALIVKDLLTNQVFNIGTGFTDALRLEIWNNKKSYMGEIVTYKHFANSGVKDKPRFPVFIGFRGREDM